MAQSGFTPILLYASGTPSNVPSAGNLTSSASGAELALNYADGKLFYKDSGGVVQTLATKGTGTIGGSTTQVQYNLSGALAGSANLTFDGTSLTLGGNPTLTAGTTNGVAYLNGSKVLTSGSALSFNGSNLGVGQLFAWGTAANNNAIDLSLYGAIYSTNSVAGVTGNAYYNGTSWTVKTVAPSTKYDQSAGQHIFYSAATPVGLGNFTPSFIESLKIDSSGNLSLASPGTFTYSSGTANGVLYLNGSKVATSGSALTFDGTTLGISGGISASNNVIVTGGSIQARNGILIYSWNSDTTNFAYLQNVGSTGTGNAQLAFALQTAGEVMRLTSTGLGIGTTPTERLDVSGNFKLSGTATLSGGTALGVAYLNGSKVLTTSSAGLTYDGSNLGVGSAAGSNARLFAYANDATLPTLVARQDGAAPIQVWQAGGSEVMRFTASGNLGIGTNNPGQRLDVSGADGVRARVVALAGGTPGLILSSSGNTAYTIKAGNADNSLRIDQDGNDRITLASGGNLGIGTSSPAHRLHVANTINSYIVAQRTTAITSALLLGAESGTTAIYSWTTPGGATGVPLNFYTGPSVAMTLDTSGNLGLGVTPSAWNTGYRALDMGSGALMAQASGADVYLTANAFFSTGGSWTYRQTSSAGRYTVVGNTHSWHTAPSGTAGNTISFTQAMTLDASGNLLVGGTSQLYGAAGRGLIQVSGSSQALLGFGTTGNVGLGFLYHTGTNFELTNAQNGYLSFGTNNTERARITSGGDLLVGTANTGAAGLGISPTLNLTFAESSGASYANLFRQANSAATILANGYKWSSTADGFASSVGTSWAKSAIGLGAVSGGTIIFYTDPAGTVANGTDVTPTERARITSTGNVVAGGSVALATTATDGFLYVPTCAGTPTGTPTAITGMAPIVVNTTNNKLYFYSGGAWRDAGP